MLPRPATITKRRPTAEPPKYNREYQVVLVARVNGTVSLPRRLVVAVRAESAEAACVLAEAEWYGFRAINAKPGLRRDNADS